MIIPQGEPGQGLVIIKEGSVAVQVIKRGAPHTVTVLPAGSYVGEMSLIDDAPTSARVTANEDGEILFIDKLKYGELLDANPQLKAKLMQVFIAELSRRLRKTNQELAKIENRERGK